MTTPSPPNASSGGNAGGGGSPSSANLAFVNVVKAYSVDNTGATDAGPDLQTAFNALAGTGQAAYLPPGTYKVQTVVTLPSDLTIWGTPGTTIKQVLTGAGNFSAFAANPVLGTPATVTAVNVIGSKVVQSSSNYAAGTWLFIVDAVGFGLRGNLYQVVSSAAAGGDFNLTLDRPVLWQFAIGDAINPVTTLLHDVRIYGNGMLFTGTSAGTVSGYVGMGTVYRCGIYDCRSDASGGSIASASVAFNFDIGSLECEIVRCRVEGAGSVVSATALQSCERSSVRDCVAQNCTGAGVALYDCVDCEDVGNSFACCYYGTLWSSNEGSPHTGYTTGCVGCHSVGGSRNGCNFAAFVQNCSSSGRIAGIAITDSINNGIYFDGTAGGTVGNVVEGCSILRTAYASNGVALLFNGNGHECVVTDLYSSLSQGAGIYVNGNSCSITVQGWTSRNDGIGGGSWTSVISPFTVNGTSDVMVKGARVQYTQTIGTNPFVFYPQGGCTLELDDVLVEEISGSTNCIIVAGQAVVSIRMRNVRSKGGCYYGYFSNAGVAVKWRFGQGNNFASCIGGPGSLDATAQANRGTVTANGTSAVAVTYADIQTTAIDTVKLTPTTSHATGSAYLSSQTAGTGFTIQSVAGDTAVYNYEIN